MPCRFLLLALLLALPPAPAIAADDEDPLAPDFLAAHNEARQAVGVPPLQWSADLAAIAQRWANRLRGDGCAMRHSGSQGIGENLAWSSGKELYPADIVAMWVDERPNYNAARNTCAPGRVCGHYTQVVWSTTPTSAADRPPAARRRSGSATTPRPATTSAAARSERAPHHFPS